MINNCFPGLLIVIKRRFKAVRMLVAGLHSCYTTVTTAECFAEALIGLFVIRGDRRSA
ncbi:hypothetical protein HanRHA438_Chr09g0378801 [Helianthus annuus]|nr:hypothetical protein HanRHA438_Chr09g0378801 [Helianthus annuus]